MNGMNQNNQMKVYNKVHSYKGYNFNIEVILDHQMERRPNGTRLHLIKINESNSLFAGKEYTPSDTLAKAITDVIKSAESWVDKQAGLDKTENDILLESLGFSR